MATPDPMNVVRDFVDAFRAGDLDALAQLLADDFVGHVTTTDGGVRDADREEYLASAPSPDVAPAHLKGAAPDLVEVEHGSVLIMATLEAERDDRSPPTSRAQLATVVDGQITELWMVDALSSERDDL